MLNKERFPNRHLEVINNSNSKESTEQKNKLKGPSSAAAGSWCLATLGGGVLIYPQILITPQLQNLAVPASTANVASLDVYRYKGEAVPCMVYRYKGEAVPA